MFLPFRLRVDAERVGPAIMLLLVVLAVSLWLSGPVLSIWALNTLFRTEIPVNFWTWLSAFWLMNLLIHRQSS